MMEYINYKSIIFIYKSYNSYLAIHSVFTGFYIIFKVYRYTKSVYLYFYPKKLIEYYTKEEDGWLIL